jgi:hypothetical protein
METQTGRPCKRVFLPENAGKGRAVKPARFGERCSNFWRSGETADVAWWVAGRRKASGLPGSAEVGLILGKM